MTRIDSLDPAERCCAAGLRDIGLPSAMVGFVAHARDHGLDADRYATLWTQELLVSAALGMMTAAREAGDSHLATIESFRCAAVTAWTEALERKGRAG